MIFLVFPSQDFDGLRFLTFRAPNSPFIGGMIEFLVTGTEDMEVVVAGSSFDGEDLHGFSLWVIMADNGIQDSTSFLASGTAHISFHGIDKP